MIIELPVELITHILSLLDLASLITVSYLSRRLHSIASDSSLNPWRGPILRNLQDSTYEPSLKTLCVRYIVPRQNWIDILSLARSEFLLFEATLPNLKGYEWEECFSRRFLPGWRKWKKEGSQWREAFMKALYRVWHRSHTSCTSDEAWTKYVVLNRNRSINELEASSRNFNPRTIFNVLKHQNNLTHLETRLRVGLSSETGCSPNLTSLMQLVVEFADVRILAFGVLNKARTMFLNSNAHAFLHPPGIEREILLDASRETDTSIGSSDKIQDLDVKNIYSQFLPMFPKYSRLTRPIPSSSHTLYPFHTPGGGDKRWIGSRELEEDGLQWVGGLMLTAQLVGSRTHENFVEGVVLQDLDLVVGMGRNQYASFCWDDFRTIAPWMVEKVTKIIFGPGLGN